MKCIVRFQYFESHLSFRDFQFQAYPLKECNNECLQNNNIETKEI